MNEKEYKKCPCGGYIDDWHSHASDCFVINKYGRCYWCNPRKEKNNGKEKKEKTG
jgi:hypothetical protein